EDFEADHRDDVHARRTTLPDQSEVEAAIKNMDEILDIASLKPYRDAFDRLHSARRGRGHGFWAELHGGPGSIYGLAKHLHHGATYRALYGYWSSTGHAKDFKRFYVVVDGHMAIRPLREPNEILSVGGSAAGFLMDASRRMLEHFRSGEDS